MTTSHRHLSAVLVLLAGGLVVAGCSGTTISVPGTRTVTGSGTVVDHTIEVGGATALDVSHGFEVNVTIGSPASAVLHVDDNLLDVLDTGEADGTLRIGIRNNTNVRDATLEADVTLPDLVGIQLSGGSVVSIDGTPPGGTLSISASGASRIDGLTLAGQDVTIQASGGSELTLDGTAASIVFDGSGASDLLGSSLTADSATVTLSGASGADLDVTGDLRYDLSGASTLTYGGDPTVTSEQVSGGSRTTTR